MIQKNDVISFFDNCAPTWDAEMIRDDAIIGTILDGAHIHGGEKVLDVACGTGVLIGDYLQRNVASVTGVDISPEMIRRAREKFSDSRVSFLCGDVESVELAPDFDVIVVYNAFPHFPDPAALIARLSSLLKSGGFLTVAHGMSRERIDAHHHNVAHSVSMGLMEADRLAELFAEHLSVTTVISDENMYQVVGKKE